MIECIAMLVLSGSPEDPRKKMSLKMFLETHENTKVFKDTKLLERIARIFSHPKSKKYWFNELQKTINSGDLTQVSAELKKSPLSLDLIESAFMEAISQWQSHNYTLINRVAKL